MQYNLGGSSYFPENSTHPLTFNDPSLLSGIQDLDQSHLANAERRYAQSSSKLRTNLILPLDTTIQGIESINEFEAPPVGQEKAIRDTVGQEHSAQSRDIAETKELLPNKPNLNLWKEMSFFQKMRIRSMSPAQAKALSEYMYTQRITPLSTEFKKKHTEFLRTGDFDSAEALEQEFAPYAAKVSQFGDLLQQQADRRLKVYDQATANNAIADQILENTAEGTPEYKAALGLKTRLTQYTPEQFLSMMQRIESSVQTENGVTTLRDRSGRTIAQHTSPTAITTEKIPEIQRDALTLAGKDINRHAYLMTKMVTDQEMTGSEVRELLENQNILSQRNQAGLTLPQRIQATKGSSVSTLLKENVSQSEIADYYNPSGKVPKGQSQGQTSRQQPDSPYTGTPRVDKPRVNTEVPQVGQRSKPGSKPTTPRGSSRLPQPDLTRQYTSPSEEISSDVGTRSPQAQKALEGVQIYIEERSAQGASQDQIVQELVSQGRMLQDGTIVVPPEEQAVEQTQEQVAKTVQNDVAQSRQDANVQPTQPGDTISPNNTVNQEYEENLDIPSNIRSKINQTQENKAAVEAYTKTLEAQATAIGQGEQMLYKDSAGAFRIEVDKNGNPRVRVSTTDTGTEARKQGWVVLKDARLGPAQQIQSVQNGIAELLSLYKDTSIPENQKAGFAKGILQSLAVGIKIPFTGGKGLLPKEVMSLNAQKLYDRAVTLAQQYENLISTQENSNVAAMKRGLTGAFSSRATVETALETMNASLTNMLAGQALQDLSEFYEGKSNTKPGKKRVISVGDPR